MAEKSIRFSIWDGNKLRAATWKLMVSPPDSLEIYLINRSLGGDLKISMHESGQWHWSYTMETFKDKLQDVSGSLDSRFIDTWQRPEETSTGVTVAQRILTPHSAVSIPISKKERRKIDSWIPNAPEQMATDIYIIITDHYKKDDTGWPGKNGMNTSLIGKLELINGGAVWAVSKIVDMPKMGKQSLNFKFFKGKSKEDIVNAESPRFLGFLDHPDGSKVLFDGKVNVSK